MGMIITRSAIVDYTMKMHSDLPKATKLRGYKDLNPAAPANPNASIIWDR